MKTHFRRALALLIAMVMLTSGLVLPTSAAEYRTGYNSASSSYMSGRYYQNYLKVPITGVNRQDLLAIALSQLGYQEGAADGSFSGTVSGSSNYVEFSYNAGDWGLGYGGSDYPWCASFVSWCLFQSRCTDKGHYKWMGRTYNNSPSGKNISDYIWKEFSCSQWTRILNTAGYLKYSSYMGGSYTPKSGDIIYFRNSNGPCHVGIVVYVSGSTVYTVEGNTSSGTGLEANGGGVYFKSYALSSSYIHSYGVLPYANNTAPSIDYSGSNPTTGLYVSNSLKYVYTTETGSTRTTDLPKYRMFEVTEVCSNGRLKINYNGLVGYINNNSDRVIQISTVVGDGTSTTPTVSDEAVAALEGAIASAEAISYTNYLESTLVQIRSAYENAVTVLNDSTSDEATYTSATSTLNDLLAVTGTNANGIRINGINEKITSGDCHIFTSAFDSDTSTTDWAVTVSNANIAYTANLVCAWDNAQQAWVVKSKSINNSVDAADINLASGEFLIACHKDDAVTDSSSSYSIVYNAEVGDALSFYGVTLQGTNQNVSVGAYIRLQDGVSDNLVSNMTYEISGDATASGDYDASLTDGIASADVNTLIGNWYAFKSDVATGETTNTVDGIGTITFDLGVSYDISKVKVHLANVYAAGVPSPASIKLSVSDDGVNFTEYGTAFPRIVGATNDYTREYSYWVSLEDIADVSGKYVRLSVEVNGTWTFLNEVEIYGTATNGEKNIVSGLDYTISGNGEPWESYTASLTDGAITQQYNALADWFAFKSDVATGTTTNTENAIGTITFDLGDLYYITNTRVFFGYKTAWGVTAPVTATFEYSEDGTTYTTYPKAFPIVPSVDGDSYGYWCSLDGLEGVYGRYVKVNVQVNGTWAFLNEIEVYGYKDPNANIIEGSDYTVSGTVDSYNSYTANLSDGIASESWGDDMWAGGVWYGFKNDVIAGVETNTVNGIANVDFALAEDYYISRARLHVGYHTGMSIKAPANVYISVSDDGVNYTQYAEAFSSVTVSETEGSYWCELNNINWLKGKYVRFVIELDGVWCFVNEVEVYGDTEVGTMGDVNLDGEIKASDYLMMRRMILNALDVNKVEEFAEWRADVTGDAQLNVSDYLLLKRAIMGEASL